MTTDHPVMEPWGTIPVPAPDLAARAQAAQVGWLRSGLNALGSGLDGLFGLSALVLGLAMCSVVPGLNLLSLGYLLHASGRVAATGRLRDGLVGLRKASVLASLVIGAWLVFLPVRFVSGPWRDAELVAPGSPASRGWHLALLVLTGLAFGYVSWAGLRGGRLRHFLWPAPLRFIRWLRHPSGAEAISSAVVRYVVSLRLPYYFWLGARGFVGALLWLLAPVGMLILAAELTPDRGGGVLSVVGGLLLMFVVFIFPARLLTGWAVGRARCHGQPRHGFFRWAGRLALIPDVLAYATWVYLMQYLSWNGTLSLLEQHAFLLPAPGLSL